MRRTFPALLLILSFAALAHAQTFTIDQPKAKANTTKVVRPDAVTVTPEPAKTEAKPTAKAAHPKPKFEETVPAAAAAKKPAHKPAVKSAKKTAPPKPTPAPEPTPEVASAAPSPKPSKPAPAPLEPVPSLSPTNPAELQQQIEAALRDNPNTSASGVQVHVTATEILLEGTVANSKQKVEAERLAQSYGGNRRFKDNLQIAGSQSAVATQSVTGNTGVPTTVGSNFNAPR
jgi:outer membrane biosynthesis protein TonB